MTWVLLLLKKKIKKIVCVQTVSGENKQGWISAQMDSWNESIALAHNSFDFSVVSG